MVLTSTAKLTMWSCESFWSNTDLSSRSGRSGVIPTLASSTSITQLLNLNNFEMLIACPWRRWPTPSWSSTTWDATSCWKTPGGQHFGNSKNFSLFCPYQVLNWQRALCATLAFEDVTATCCGRTRDGALIFLLYCKRSPNLAMEPISMRSAWEAMQSELRSTPSSWLARWLADYLLNFVYVEMSASSSTRSPTLLGPLHLPAGFPRQMSPCGTLTLSRRLRSGVQFWKKSLNDSKTRCKPQPPWSPTQPSMSKFGDWCLGRSIWSRSQEHQRWEGCLQLYWPRQTWLTELPSFSTTMGRSRWNPRTLRTFLQTQVPSSTPRSPLPFSSMVKRLDPASTPTTTENLNQRSQFRFQLNLRMSGYHINLDLVMWLFQDWQLLCQSGCSPCWLGCMWTLDIQATRRWYVTLLRRMLQVRHFLQPNISDALCASGPNHLQQHDQPRSFRPSASTTDWWWTWFSCGTSSACCAPSWVR